MTAAPLLDNTRTLVLTGASRGIGHATVKKFSAGGWRVITVSRQPFSALCPWPGGDKNHVQIDLAEPDDVGRGIEEIRDRVSSGRGGGRLDALVNNAAISPKDETGGRLGAIDTPFDLWQRVFNVNFFAPVALARGLMDELSAARGCVVNVTSIAGSRVRPFAGSAYATSKAALAALRRELCERRRDPDQRRPARLGVCHGHHDHDRCSQRRNRPRRAPPHPRRWPSRADL